MTIPDPLRDRAYACGELVQYCRDCDWAQRGHRCELAECPQCGAPLPAEMAIELGGIAIVRHPCGFDILAMNGSRVALESADLPEVIQFLCRHTADIRNASYSPPARVRRIDKTLEVEEMLDLVRRGRRESPA